ncbi:D-alanyl-D-alanine carboxypeptidase family protein [Streptococcus uberis]|uniref:M15 family metallopeptidase n=1 Tax=Streptococcus uberis TaxID=1349 RepID=UPI00062042A5|nr:D-alanyl-D-alanine carboxypeptidase family protein [Streptococcus uberis]KKF55146.1 D-alanyl-D-alanine carboxypeptidase [Streptococcus uberis 6780]MCK1159968.1 D-alanyl-D-alanine carboxypeptidase family protein [Streptococcus uberis]MCK1161743.1 D-alanyl-D-alanine carboxypeptidase family protein [Streptococcus uberis]MCK1165493.1 D-alanyl-D-alanine carboxypeptidase family protein [Streptococcus uberis]MCK1189395.1 D-alanyl-D-alanine carboxypeptidase family protein [Streptococcus uberis]
MKNNKLLSFLFQLLVILLFIFCLFYYIKAEKEPAKTTQKETLQKRTVAKQDSQKDLPNVSIDDWELVLVNRDHPKEEMNPELVDINGISVDKRIADATAEFLAAAQAVNAQEHLISGYRSVAYQAELYQSYVSQEMANDPSLTQEAAEAIVQTYSQPAGSSEHQTGLAIDMSTVDALNQSDVETVKQVTALAPKYGFILRFPDGKQESTGVGYEDWHFRYVGKKSAAYISKHQISLEEYIKLLKEKK